MAHLYELIQRRVAEWRAQGYSQTTYRAIAELLEHATLPETGTLRYLRAVQLRALETRWYLRLEGTPQEVDRVGLRMSRGAPDRSVGDGPVIYC